jgi:hypothetical protein
MAQTLNTSIVGYVIKNEMRKDLTTFVIYTSRFPALHVFSFYRLMNWVNAKVDNIVLLSHTSLQVLKRK